MMEGFVEVDAPNLAPGDIHRFEVDGSVRLLVRTGSGIFALDGICTHEDAELADGDIDDGILWCPLHAAGFRVDTGAVVCNPAPCGLRTYAVEHRDGSIFVSRAQRHEAFVKSDRKSER